MPLLEVIHFFYLLVGVSAGFVLIIVILTTKSSGLKSYSVILFNVACVDMVGVLCDGFDVPRLVVGQGQFVLLFHGYCTSFGPENCFRFHMVMIHLFIFSLFLLALSFWFRYTVLVKETPSWYKLQIIIAILAIPNVLPMILSMFSIDRPEKTRLILHSIYPAMDLNSTTHRSTDFFDPYSLSMICSASFSPLIAYSYIIFTRKKVLRKLAFLAEHMSEKTKQMHVSLVRALTYHAIMPSTVCIGVLGYCLELSGMNIALIDGMIFTFICIPAVLNPIFTLCLVVPYRRRVLQAIGRKPASTLSIVPRVIHPH